MNSGNRPSLLVKDFYQETKGSLKLQPVLTRYGFTREIILSTTKKAFSNVQIWGRKEIQDFKRFSPQEKNKFFKLRLGDDVACVILTNSLSYLPRMEKEARKKGMPLFLSELSGSKFRETIEKIDWKSFSAQAIGPGGLLKIFGLGVLIVGDSGIGKSESTLELISRGHRFISDDVTLFKKTPGGKLIGLAPQISRDFMEIRGLGIINIKEIFGIKSICRQIEIDFVIRLKKWEKGKDEDRLGLEFPEEYEILGFRIPQIKIPVAPGRNIATLIEIACKVYVLKKKGYYASQEIIKKLDRALALH